MLSFALNFSFRSKDIKSEVADFDPNAAFFKKVISKKKKLSGVSEAASGKGKGKGGDKKKNDDVRTF